MFPSPEHQFVISTSLAEDIVNVQFAFKDLEFGEVDGEIPWLASVTDAGQDKRDCSCFLGQSSHRANSTSPSKFNEMRENIFGQMSSMIQLLTCWQQERILKIIRRNRSSLSQWLLLPDSICSPDYQIIGYLNAHVGHFKDRI